MNEQAVQAIRQQMEALWNQGDFTLLDTLFAPDFTRYFIDGQVIRGPEQMGEHILGFRMQYPDMHIDFQEFISDNNALVVHWRFVGTDKGHLPGDVDPPTGKLVDVSGVDILHLVDGQIQDNYVYYNLLQVMQQMGVVPQLVV